MFVHWRFRGPGNFRQRLVLFNRLALKTLYTYHINISPIYLSICHSKFSLALRSQVNIANTLLSSLK